MSQKGGDVPAIHHAGMIGHAFGHIDLPDDRHAVLDDGLARFGNVAVAAAFSGEIDDHRTERHAFDHLFGHQHGRFFPRNYRRRDYYITFLHRFSQQLALTAIEVFILRARIAASVLRIFRFNGEFDETAAEALYLLFRRRP